MLLLQEVVRLKHCPPCLLVVSRSSLDPPDTVKVCVRCALLWLQPIVVVCFREGGLVQQQHNLGATRCTFRNCAFLETDTPRCVFISGDLTSQADTNLNPPSPTPSTVNL